MRSLWVLSTAFVLVILSLVVATAVIAQGRDSNPTGAGVNLTLNPVFVSLITDPGESISSQFTVTNNNNFTEFFEVKLAKFAGSVNGGSPTILDIEKGDEFAEWIDFSDTKIEIAPNQNKTIKFTISPPESSGLGYYYAILVTRQLDPKTGETGTAVIAAPALPVLLNVRSPNAKRELQIVDFKTDKVFYEYLPTTFQVAVKNTGNIHSVPVADIFIDSMFYEDVAVLSANSGRGNILPNSERTFTATWNDAFALREKKVENDIVVKDNEGNPKYKTDFNFSEANKFRIGRYTANLLLVYDNGERDIPIEAKITFWVVPWKIIGGTLAVLVLVLIGLRSTLMPVIGRIKQK